MQIKLKTLATLILAALLLCAPALGAASVPTAPSPPATLRAKRASNSSIRLWWKQVKGAQGYTVYRADPGSSKYKAIKTVKGQTKSFYLDKKLEKNKTYRYKLRAYKSYLDSEGELKKRHSADSFSVSARSYTKAAKTVNVGKVKAKNAITIGIREERKVKAKLTPHKLSKAKGKKVLSKKLKRSITNKEIAKVNKQGVVTGKEAGTTSLKIRAHNGYTKTVKVRVKNYALPESFDLRYDVPSDMVEFFTNTHAEITALADYFQRNPKAGEGSITIKDPGDGSDWILVVDGLDLGPMEEVARHILLECPYDISINICDEGMLINMSYFNGVTMVFHTLDFSYKKVDWGDLLGSTVFEIAPRWYYDWGAGV